MTDTERLVHEFQQPPWPDRDHLSTVESQLRNSAPIANSAEIVALDHALEEVRRGAAFTVQLGDCAESFSPRAVQNSLALAGLAGEITRRIADRCVLPGIVVVRTAGQFAKPRSKAYEMIGSMRLPVFRGHIVNGPDGTPDERAPNPDRMLTAYRQARRSAAALGSARPGEHPVWIGHEAMLLPYERALRRVWDGTPFSASGHFLWIGDRTRELDSPIVELLASLANPIGCKIGPTANPVEIAALLGRLRRHHRRTIVLIVRLGVRSVATKLPELIDGLGPAATEVVWVVDPLHGNHEETSIGLRTRRLPHAIEEIQSFAATLTGCGLHPGGIHLESTWDDVLECVDDVDGLPDPTRYRSLMDPRLNPEQTVRAADAFAAMLTADQQAVEAP